MLILARHVGEMVTIGEDVTATVLSVKGSQVGVNAPRDVSVHRQEIYDRITMKNEPHEDALQKPRADRRTRT